MTPVPDVLEIDVPAGGRIVVVSDLHLGAEATPASAAAATELSQTIEAWVGPGVLVFAGDFIELWATDTNSVERALAAHARLAAEVAVFAGGAGRRVICLAGNHDARLAWDHDCAAAMALILGAEVALALSLRIQTGSGPQLVRVEHGHQLDPANALGDPRDPHETPVGYHLSHDVLPTLAAGGDWLCGLESLADPVDFPAFVASRLAYRRLGGRLGWLLVPFALALVLRLPLIYALAARMGRASGLDTGARVLVALGAVIVTDVAVVTVAVAAAARRAWAATCALVVGGRGLAQNDAARVRARQLVAEGYAGLVTGHTHHPELAVLDGGFYANTGSGSVVVERAGARLGLPGVFAAHIQLSWIELEAAASLHVRLLHGRRDLPGTTLLERLVAGRAVVTRGRPAVVASYPPGPSWPPTADPALGVRRIRRVAAAAIAAAGVLNIVSAFTPPLGDRLRALLDLVPLSVPQAATGAEVIGGLGLLLVARGIRRGQRRAWAVSIVLLGLAAVLHVAKGVDVEEAAAVVALAVYLLRHRSAFSGGVRPASARQGAVGAVLAGLAATALGTVVVEIGSGAERPSLGRAVLGVAQRIVLVGGTSLPARPLNEFLTPALGAVGVSLALFAGWVALRPVLAAHHRPGRDLDQARDIVRRHGAGTLAYFALRDDKRHFFAGESVVAYGVFAGVCLVSPDPVGPVAEREQVWAAFRSFADRHSWAVAVMGAAEDWLPTYRRAGMRDLYVGDEAVVDCRRFSLDGNRNKGLRQAVIPEGAASCQAAPARRVGTIPGSARREDGHGARADTPPACPAGG